MNTRPVIIVVDDFFEDPYEIRNEALRMEYKAAPAYYKGVRADWPASREWEAIQGILDLPAICDRYSCFQKTTETEPLVWHSDQQAWAGAVYLTPDKIDSGTSFWRDKTFLTCRPHQIDAINRIVYSKYNLTHPDEWELVDRIGSKFNRLVLWNAQLIHSATSYTGFTQENPRLVELFFFN